MNLDISHSDYKKSLDIHGTVLYPAMMVAPVQKEVLTWLIAGRKNLKVFDPFHGSGTALFEAADIDESISVFGNDINPLASLITLVKLQGIDEQSFEADYQTLENTLNDDKVAFPVISFYKSDKWFKSDVIRTLSKVVFAIKEIKNEKNRRFFWVILCDIIRKYSNTRSSTYKLHIKEQTKIDAIKNNVIKDYLIKVRASETFYHKHFLNFDLKKGDSLFLMEKESDNFYDIIITSPPYGDNATTVPYGQFSYLQLSFIDRKDIPFDGWELENCGAIDSSSMGGWKTKKVLTDEEKAFIQKYLVKITKSKQLKVIRFFADYFFFLDQASRVAKQYIVMTLGNRTVNRININLVNVSISYLEAKGYTKVDKLSRKILCKRTPDQILVKNRMTSTMTKEYVIIMKKNSLVSSLDV